MFKVGDKVIYTHYDDVYSSITFKLEIGKTYTINYVSKVDFIFNKPMYYIIVNGNPYRHLPTDFILDNNITQQRKEKLEKICLKLEIE